MVMEDLPATVLSEAGNSSQESTNPGRTMAWWKNCKQLQQVIIHLNVLLNNEDKISLSDTLNNDLSVKASESITRKFKC